MKPILISILSIFLVNEVFAQCPTPVVTLTDVDPTSVVVEYTNGMFVEWGPMGFTPGTDSLPGAGGTIYYCPCVAALVTGLAPLTTYDLYVRSYCGSSGFSSNSNMIRFTTPTCPPVINYGSLGSTTTITFGGFGYYSGYDFFNSDQGAERVLHFTPSMDGFYQVRRQRVPTVFFPGSFFYREKDTICSFYGPYDGLQLIGYKEPLNTITSTSYDETIYDIGPLTAGTLYELFFDSYDTTFSALNTADISITYTGCNYAPLYISGTHQMCAGYSAVLHQRDGILSTNGSFEWYTDSCGGNHVGSGDSIIISPTDTTTYFVRAESPCGTSLCRSFQVNVLQGTLPAQPPAITGPPRPCPGSTVTYSIPSIPGATMYQWSVKGTGPFLTIINDTIASIVLDNSFQGGSISVKAQNQCGFSPVTTKYISRQSPRTPGAISGQRDGLCNGITTSYSLAPVSQAISYNWTVTPAATIVSGQGTTSIDVAFNPLFGGGTISVSASDSCSAGNARTIRVTGAPATPQAIIGDAGVCVQQLAVPYSVSPVATATSYNWTVSPGAQIATGQGTANITVDHGITGSLINVWAVNSCASSAVRSLRTFIVCREANEEFEAGMIYPNPASDYFTFYPGEMIQDINITVYDLSGRVVEQSATTSGNSIQFGSELPSGSYIIEVSDGNAMKTFRAGKM